ncbi:helix-turn-helix domain-containing protein [Actinotalea ferrariae]|uniref:helix-turn-helix domain-containing protein n=1 Tax=Actinotalea ferrariae TaxID=1386098 RepID=UPI001C8CE160|nr:helix-turn-helix domain-containing protein [Actinotalea ferrariae]MBX9245890.1 helix-turn-helix domain-containing protein [Actinotalea ferrariae]
MTATAPPSATASRPGGRRPELAVRPVRPARPEPLFRHLVGHILRAHREAQGRTLRDVARDARVSVAYLSEIERGRKEASSEVLMAVCRALGMGLVDLLGEAHGALVGASRPVVVDLAARPAGDDRAAHALAPSTGASAVLRAA